MKKYGKGTVLSIKEHFKCILWLLASLLWTEHKFNCGITRFKGGRADVEDDPCPGCPSTATTDENIEAVRTIILDNRRILIREVCRWCWNTIRLMPSKFYECFGHETGISKDCYKIAKFWAKTTSYIYRSKYVDDVQRQSRRSLVSSWLTRHKARVRTPDQASK